MNDLLLCLVGIAGDIFVHDGECFRINKTCDLFSMSEREQLKQLIPLGSAYLRLQDFISAHEARWDVRTETVDVYKMAMCSSISDFINRYCDDIAFIEEALDKDQSLTSTFILVHLQKYLIVAPVLLKLIVEVDRGEMSGSMLLNLLSQLSCGIPVVNEVIDRFTANLMVVFIRQCLAWMLFGVLEEEEKNTFLIVRKKPRRWNSKGVESLDWTGCFAVDFSKLPTDFVTPRLAAKVLFAGKVVTLFNTSTTFDLDPLRENVVKYLSRGMIAIDSPARPAGGIAEDGVFRESDLHRFNCQVSNIIDSDHKRSELLESLIADVHGVTSRRLWEYLRDDLKVMRYFQVARNMYLLGSGELFQCIMERVHALSLKSMPAPHTLDDVLEWEVVRDSAKALGLEDDVVGELLSLRVRSTDIAIFDFLSQSNEYSLSGSASVEFTSAEGDGTKLRIGNRAKFESHDMLQAWWTKSVSGGSKLSNTALAQPSLSTSTVIGAVFLSEQMQCTKSFRYRVCFLLDWNDVRDNIGSSDRLFVGSISCMLQRDQSSLPAPTTENPFGTDTPGSICSTLAVYAESMGGGLVRLFGRLFVSCQSPKAYSTDTPSTEVLGECFFEIGVGGLTAESLAETQSRKVLDGEESLCLEVDYTRGLRTSISPTMSSSLKTRVLPSRAVETNTTWDVTVPLDIGKLIKGEKFFIGSVGSACLLPTSRQTTVCSFGLDVVWMEFKSSRAHENLPSTCSHTSIRFPDTALRLDLEISRIRTWMNLKFQFHFPSLLTVLIDSDATATYDRLFALLFKVRLVGHLLERQWASRSSLLNSKPFNQLRHSMHFFISNLTYYLQIDVVDSQYAELQQALAVAKDYQAVLHSHRQYLAALTRLSLVDNGTVQDGVDRVIHACLRFIAIFRITTEQQERASAPLPDPTYVPVFICDEELESVRSDFFSHLSFLFQVMRKIESKGFMFRLDYNGYLTSLINP